MLIKTQEWIDHCFSLDSEFRHIDRYRQIDKLPKLAIQTEAMINSLLRFYQHPPHGAQDLIHYIDRYFGKVAINIIGIAEMITPATGTKLKTKTMIPKLSSWGMFMIAKIHYIDRYFGKVDIMQQFKGSFGIALGYLKSLGSIGFTFCQLYN